MNKETDARINTRQILIDTFCALYKVKPIQKITIKELADKAGYNRSTFYKYFDDIYGLLAEIENELILLFKESVITAIQSASFDDAYFSSFISIQETNANMVDALLANPNNLRSPERLKMELKIVFAQALNLSETDAKAHYILEFYSSGVISIIRRWLINDKDISSEALAGLGKSFFSELILPQVNKRH